MEIIDTKFWNTRKFLSLHISYSKEHFINRETIVNIVMKVSVNIFISAGGIDFSIERQNQKVPGIMHGLHA